MRDPPRVLRGPASDELLRLIFDSATDFAIFTMDPNGVVTSWNSGAERLLGYKEEEILGGLADVMFVPADGGFNAAAEERRIALAHGRAEDERWQQRRDGTRFWASGLLMPLADRTQGFVKILRDRSSQHRAEERLRKSEELFRLLATNIPQLVFRSAGSGQRTWASPQWSVYSGVDFQASLDLGWLDAIHPEDRERTLSAWQEAASRGEYYVEHRIRRSADAQYRWHQTRAVPLSSGEGVAVEWVGTSTDIHELRTLQDEQHVLLAELQHRTRNLLSVVQAIARQTLRKAPSLQHFAAEFESRLGALGRVQRLLASSEHAHIALRDLIELELTAHGDDGRRSDRITLDGPPAELPAGAVQLLALVLHELATNALKYGALSQPQGQLAIRWSLEDDRTGARHIRLLWQESGVRMPSDVTRRGYGRELIERALAYQLSAAARLEFGSDGVRCEIIVRADAPPSGR